MLQYLDTTNPNVFKEGMARPKEWEGSRKEPIITIEGVTEPDLKNDLYNRSCDNFISIVYSFNEK